MEETQDPSLRRKWRPGKGLLRCLLVVITAIGLSRSAADRVDAQDGAVDLALVLAIDCSYSVDMAEFHLQITGTAEAFRLPEIHAAIASGTHRRIAVSVVQWSDMEHQQLVVPWTIVSGPSSAEALAQAIETLPRSLAEGGTSIAHALVYGAQLISSLPYPADRLVIDIAADGRNNNGGDPRPVRDAVVAQGMTINGLAILNEVPTLDKYFERYITGGPANFVIVANDYSAYAAAIYRKLLREIIGPRVS
jgi:hypothetical protein